MGMDYNVYMFAVSTVNSSIQITNNNSWYLLDNLQSGSPYSISVVTVGVRNYTSTAVTAQYYTSECLDSAYDLSIVAMKLVVLSLVYWLIGSKEIFCISTCIHAIVCSFKIILFLDYELL